MSEQEVADFLQGVHTMQVATIGRDGRPHLVAMWYGFLDGALALWTYGRSQKVVNLRRDPRITCLVEWGRAYDELKGVELLGVATILEDGGSVLDAGRSVWERNVEPLSDEVARRVERMSAKRVAVRIEVEKVVSWDHAKLGPTP